MSSGNPLTKPTLSSLITQARRHGGVITYAQARALGFTRDRLMTLLARKLAARQFGMSQFVISDAVESPWRAVANGLVLRLGPATVVSGAAAAQCLGALGDWPQTFGVEMPIAYLPQGTHKRVDGVKLLRRTMDGAIVQRRQLRLADMTTALLDCVDAATESQREAFVDFLLQRRWLDRARVERRIASRSASGRTGRRVTSAQKLTMRQAQEGTESQAERLLSMLLSKAKLRRGGARGWTANYVVRVTDGGANTAGAVSLAGAASLERAACGFRSARIDFAWPDCKLAVEVDGRAFHSSDEAFENDRDRRNDLEAADWMVLNVTWKGLTRAPDSVVCRIRAALKQRRVGRRGVR